MNTLTISALIILAVFLAIYFAVVILDLRKAKKNNEKYHKSEWLAAFLMLLPALILTFFFILLPILYSLGYSFTDYYLLKPNEINFNGFENFVIIFKEIANKGMLYDAIKNTAIFVVLVVPLQIFVALGLALLCNQKRFGVSIFKICFFAPMMVSLTVTSYLWLQILSPSKTGLMNSFLALFGVESQEFLQDPNTAILWIVLLSAWQGAGYQMIIFLSALGNIRSDLYEAASLDGANAWHKFTRVTIPGIRPTFIYVLITVFIGACRIMVQPMLMIGYQKNGVTISYYMYQEGYYNRWVGASSAVALLMTIFIGSITLLQRKLFSEKK